MAIDASFGDDHKYKPTTEEQLHDYKRRYENLQRLNNQLEEQSKYYIKEIFELRTELKYAQTIINEFKIDDELCR